MASIGLNKKKKLRLSKCRTNHNIQFELKTLNGGNSTKVYICIEEGVILSRSKNCKGCKYHENDLISISKPKKTKYVKVLHEIPVRRHPLDPKKDDQSLYCDTTFLENFFNKKLKNEDLKIKSKKNKTKPRYNIF
jgi:hypothetical protein